MTAPPSPLKRFRAEISATNARGYTSQIKTSVKLGDLRGPDAALLAIATELALIAGANGLEAEFRSAVEAGLLATRQTEAA